MTRNPLHPAGHRMPHHKQHADDDLVVKTSTRCFDLVKGDLDVSVVLGRKGAIKGTEIGIGG